MPRLLVGDECDGIGFKCLAKQPSRDAPTFGRRDSLFILLIILPCRSWAWSGKVVGVADGDTITVLRDRGQVRIRLYGIDCPEGGQGFGKRAKQFTSKMVYGKVAEVKVMATDRYGRTVAMIYADKTLLNEELVKAGLAWVYWKYCHIPFVSLGRTSSWEPGWTSVDCGLTRTAYRLGSLGEEREGEVGTQ